MMQRFYSFNDYWNLYHKVIFDPERKLVYINAGETSLHMGRDVYSSFKEWFRINENSQYPPVMRTIGGDPTVGGNFAGTIYFFINGWRMYLDKTVNIQGSVFSDDYESPYVTDPMAHLAFSQVANLVDRLDTVTGVMTVEQIRLLEQTAKRSEIEVVNNGVKRASKLIPHNESLPDA